MHGGTPADIFAVLCNEPLRIAEVGHGVAAGWLHVIRLREGALCLDVQPFGELGNDTRAKELRQRRAACATTACVKVADGIMRVTETVRSFFIAGCLGSTLDQEAHRLSIHAAAI